MPKNRPYAGAGATIVAAAVLSAAFAASAQGDAGEQVYLKIELENVQITSYQLGILDSRISRALDAGGRFTAADVSTASREAAAKLKSKLGDRTGTAEVVVCVPPASRTCIQVVCRNCRAE